MCNPFKWIWKFMTLFSRVEALEAAVAAEKTIDPTAFASATDLAALSATVATNGAALTTLEGLVGTPTPPATPPAA